MMFYEYKTRLIGLAIALLTTIAAIAQTGFTGRSFTTRDGLPSNRIHDFIQDKTGYIWLGTSNGLCRYDGYSFMTLQSLGDNTMGNVGTIHLDERNNLMWMRTATFNYACYDLNRRCFVDYYGKCDPQKSFERFITEDNGIWMYEAKAGIRHVTYNKGKFTCRDYTKENGSLPDCRVKRMRMAKDGHVWVLTDKGLLRTDDNCEFRSIAKNGDFMSWNDFNDKCLLLTRDGSVMVFSLSGKLIAQTVVPAEFGDMGMVNGSFVWQDRWVIMTRTAVIVVDCSTMKFEKPAACQTNYGLLLDEMDGNFWVSGRGGELMLFPKKGEVKTFQLIGNSALMASQRRNYATIQGRDGRFYIATYGNGLYVYDPRNGQMEHFSARDQHPIINSNYLMNIHQDRDGNIWVSQEDAGIVKISQSNLANTSILLPDPANRGEKTNYINNLYRDKDGSIIISTKSKKDYRLTPSDNKIEQTEIPGSNFLHTDSITDRQGRTWIATWEQGLLMASHDNNGKRIEEHLLTGSIAESRINSLAIDRQGMLWVATYNGIYYADTKQKKITSESFSHIGTKQGLANNDIVCLLTTSDGSTWAGGIGTGLVRCRLRKGEPEITVLSTRQGLSNNNIHSMAEDHEGNIWAGTDEAMSYVDTKSMRPTNFQVGTTMLNNIYSNDCALTLDDGRLLFGTHDGITVINPNGKQINLNRSTQEFITNIEINGMSIFNDEKYKDMRTLSGDVELDYNENSLTFYMSSFDFISTEPATYQFYLKGLENDWREPSTQHTVDYGNLPPGRYTFCVRSDETGEVTTLNIKINQPWYNTWWAWIMYLTIIGGFIVTYLYHQQIQLRLRQQMAIDKEVSEFRANFFTQVAHEFRTPLAIISSAVDKLSEEGNSQRKPIQTARRGVRRLTQLVNQFMEFRKINTGNLRLQVEEGEIIGFVRDIYQDFWNSAQQKEQNLSFTAFDKKYTMYFDRHFIDVIAYNLISNAVKYTPQGGTIMVRLKQEDGKLKLIVEDSGPGIDEARREQMFQPFMHGYASQGGMGIGLYTAYRMAQSHKGRLSYHRSDKLGGSKFTLVIPADENSYEADEYKRLTAVERTENQERQTDNVILEMMPNALNDMNITVIEDDPDMLDQIKTEVGVYFKTSGYTNGAAGLEAMRQSKPSLLICDVMLPDTNGYDIVKQMRADEALRDIPVIMLTALDDEKHQIKGYESGADDYMVKPCNYRILIARAVQLIKWSEAHRQQESVATAESVPTSAPASAEPTIITSQADKRFLEKIETIVSQHLNDPDFSIDQMAEMMKMGRTKLYGKVKEMTGMSPNKLFTERRMQMAKQLLEEGELNISEIAYKIGIPDASYFNKCFKQYYGVAPSKYRKGS